MIDTLIERAGERGHVLAATRLAEGLFGNSVAANFLMLGYARQAGLVPISKDSIEAAIEANGAAITLNKRAFAWGRLAALEPATVAQLAGLPESTHASRGIEDETLAEGNERRAGDLADRKSTRLNSSH